MDVFGKLVEKIVVQQESIIGPLALEQAKKVNGLSIDLDKKEITFSGDKKEILKNLVEKYERLFGRASVEVCKDAARTFTSQIPHDQLPSLLQ